MGKLYKDLKEALEECLAYEQGKITLRTEVIEIPDAPEEYTASDIKQIRAKGDYSQSIFAKILNVSIKTVQSWESGERKPSHAALRLLEIVNDGIYRPRIYQKTAKTPRSKRRVANRRSGLANRNSLADTTS